MSAKTWDLFVNLVYRCCKQFYYISSLLCWLLHFHPTVFVDFVLVYEEDMETLELKKQGKIGKKDKKDQMTTKDKHEVWRQKFLANLHMAGLEMEEVSEKDNVNLM